MIASHRIQHRGNVMFRFKAERDGMPPAVEDCKRMTGSRSGALTPLQPVQFIMPRRQHP
jgi:hypothetical protein